MPLFQLGLVKSLPVLAIYSLHRLIVQDLKITDAFKSIERHFYIRSPRVRRAKGKAELMDTRMRRGRLLLDCLQMHDSLDCRELFRLEHDKHVLTVGPHRRTSQLFPLALPSHLSLTPISLRMAFPLS